MSKNPDPITRYCLTCRYPLCGLDVRACPECGRPFNPLDPRTTAFYPTGEFRRGVAITGQMLTVGIGFFGVVVVIASALGVNPLILWLGGFASVPFIFASVAITALPAVPLSRHSRCRAIIAVVLLVSVVLTGWPFRVSLALHRSALERYVDQVRSGATPTGTGSTTVGLFTFSSVYETAEGTVGLQMSGGAGGGIYLVHCAPGGTLFEFNVGWKRDLGAGWFHIYED